MLPRAKFLQALKAEGVSCCKGYSTLNKIPYLNNALQSKYFQKMYPKEMLDYGMFMEKNQCPLNDKLCNEEAVWVPQNVLLAEKSDMDEIADAIGKIKKNASDTNSKI